ncbi:MULTISPECIES: hypothetical protein [Heyndrickxia]|jgi:hypothetical protein|uniref:hypothetical protein n=2 Tax=Bacillaceae TaxID=186817 RepID=UPI00077902CF|nr:MULTISPECIES: hypothetical protein [Heyndrickxia]MDT9754901.1 hypothetical protein [Heyndrickxia coagulans]MED4890561.1 hypothetical protein [Weizmannia sp. CD-2023]MED4977838.1 hypothetical protein [Weizmannia sp. CD-2023]
MSFEVGTDITRVAIEIFFGGLKRPKAAWLVFEMSFWGFEKAKSGLVGVRNVFLEVTKGQKWLG